MKIALLMFLTLTVVLVLIGWVVASFWFSGEDHSRYDEPRPAIFQNEVQSDAHAALVTEIEAGQQNASARGIALIKLMRSALDDRGASYPISSRIEVVTSGAVSGEWVIAKNAMSSRRMLYIHGGGYTMGSPMSHRPITDRLSEISKAAVFAVSYRLLPEHSRRDGIDDVVAAYQWLQMNSPDSGNAQLESLLVAGDSAGGNLALMVAAHARDSDLRMPDALIVMSPQTDATYQSPSLIENIATDVMQGRSFGPVVKAPRFVSLWISFFINRINPSDPLVSPLLGTLEGLPPTLIQVSDAEMFRDDAIRYANKAAAQGSKVEIQIWKDLVHVWQAFDVPEAEAAFDRIEQFLSDVDN